MPIKNSDASFGQELIVDAAEFSDSGRYQCIAVNTASGIPRAVVDFTLSVECESASFFFSLSLSLRFNGHFPGRPGLAGTRMSPFWNY